MKRIETEDDYERILERIDALMHAGKDTPELEELKRLTMMVERYEDEHYPIGQPTEFE